MGRYSTYLNPGILFAEVLFHYFSQLRIATKQLISHGRKICAFFVRYIVDKGEYFVVKIDWQVQFGIWTVKLSS